MRLEDGRTAPCKARVVERTDNGNAWLEVTVTEGRNRLDSSNSSTSTTRSPSFAERAFATISARNCERGKLRKLTGEELSRLREIADGKDPKKAGKSSRYKKGFAKPKPKNAKGTRRRRTLNKRVS